MSQTSQSGRQLVVRSEPACPWTFARTLIDDRVREAES